MSPGRLHVRVHRRQPEVELPSDAAGGEAEPRGDVGGHDALPQQVQVVDADDEAAEGRRGAGREGPVDDGDARGREDRAQVPEV
jgi:hypothetical protein